MGSSQTLTSSGSKPSGSTWESNKGGLQLSQQLTETGTNVWPRSGETEHTHPHVHMEKQRNRVKKHQGENNMATQCSRSSAELMFGEQKNVICVWRMASERLVISVGSRQKPGYQVESNTHTKTIWTMLFFQLCGNASVKALLCSNLMTSHKARTGNWWFEGVCSRRTWLTCTELWPQSLWAPVAPFQ